MQSRSADSIAGRSGESNGPIQLLLERVRLFVVGVAAICILILKTCRFSAGLPCTTLISMVLPRASTNIGRRVVREWIPGAKPGRRGISTPRHNPKANKPVIITLNDTIVVTQTSAATIASRRVEGGAGVYPVDPAEDLALVPPWQSRTGASP